MTNEARWDVFNMCYRTHDRRHDGIISFTSSSRSRLWRFIQLNSPILWRSTADDKWTNIKFNSIRHGDQDRKNTFLGTLQLCQGWGSKSSSCKKILVNVRLLTKFSHSKLIVTCFCSKNTWKFSGDITFSQAHCSSSTWNEKYGLVLVSTSLGKPKGFQFN